MYIVNVYFPVDCRTTGIDTSVLTDRTATADPFEAKKFVKRLNITSREEWRKYTKNAPQEIFNQMPKTPSMIYKNKGWAGPKDFFGWPDKKRIYLSYNDAKAIIKTYFQPNRN